MPAIAAIPIPAGCETDCVVYCTDPCSQIGWTHANCRLIEGPCKRTLKNKAKGVCRECACTWPFGGCVDLGFYNSGTVQILECQ